VKIATWNVNGIRKRELELLDWLEREQPDVMCLQEIKALEDQVPMLVRHHGGYWARWHGEKGYSGVALLLKKETFPDPPRFDHPPFDYEARIVTATAGEHVFASTYVPNGGKDFPAKMRYLHDLAEWLRALRANGESITICGDFNVARTPVDVHAGERKKTIGQLPEERALLERVLSHGLDDVLRSKHPDDEALYTWWAPWRNMREKNLGWRLDYVITTHAFAERVVACDVDRAFGTSDHGVVLAKLQD
jgi:exodeoxyribonuclease-3